MCNHENSMQLHRVLSVFVFKWCESQYLYVLLSIERVIDMIRWTPDWSDEIDEWWITRALSARSSQNVAIDTAADTWCFVEVPWKMLENIIENNVRTVPTVAKNRYFVIKLGSIKLFTQITVIFYHFKSQHGFSVNFRLFWKVHFDVLLVLWKKNHC